MVTAASGHWVIAEHHQGNEVGHLQRPSWPPPQFHPERGIQGREKEEKGLRRHLDLNPKNRQEQTKGQTNYIAFWTSRNNVRGEPTEVKENRRREKTWGKDSPSTNTDSVATAEVFCFEETLMLVWFTLSQLGEILIIEYLPTWNTWKKLHRSSGDVWTTAKTHTQCMTRNSHISAAGINCRHVADWFSMNPGFCVYEAATHKTVSFLFVAALHTTPRHLTIHKYTVNTKYSKRLKTKMKISGSCTTGLAIDVVFPAILCVCTGGCLTCWSALSSLITLPHSSSSMEMV